MAIKEKQEKTVKNRKSVSGKLLRILIPMVALSIIFIILFVSGKAKGIIMNLAEDSLSEESEGNAEKLGVDIAQLSGSLQMAATTLQNVKFADDQSMAKYLTEYYDGKVQHFRENSAPLFA